MARGTSDALSILEPLRMPAVPNCYRQHNSPPSRHATRPSKLIAPPLKSDQTRPSLRISSYHGLCRQSLTRKTLRKHLELGRHSRRKQKGQWVPKHPLSRIREESRGSGRYSPLGTIPIWNPDMWSEWWHLLFAEHPAIHPIARSQGSTSVRRFAPERQHYSDKVHHYPKMQRDLICKIDKSSTP